MKTTSTTLKTDFAKFAGELAESFSFNRSLGQIYGLLYLSPSPMSLEDIATELMMSKGNASLNLRALEQWGAVRSVAVSGTRRDFYEADKDIGNVLLRRFEEGFSKRLSQAESRLRDVDERLKDVGGGSEGKFLRERLAPLQSLVGKARRALQTLPKMARFI